MLPTCRVLPHRANRAWSSFCLVSSGVPHHAAAGLALVFGHPITLGVTGRDRLAVRALHAAAVLQCGIALATRAHGVWCFVMDDPACAARDGTCRCDIRAAGLAAHEERGQAEAATQEESLESFHRYLVLGSVFLVSMNFHLKIAL